MRRSSLAPRGSSSFHCYDSLILVMNIPVSRKRKLEETDENKSAPTSPIKKPRLENSNGVARPSSLNTSQSQILVWFTASIQLSCLHRDVARLFSRSILRRTQTCRPSCSSMRRPVEPRTSPVKISDRKSSTSADRRPLCPLYVVALFVVARVLQLTSCIRRRGKQRCILWTPRTPRREITWKASFIYDLPSSFQ